jgi:hypothetical protein
MPGASCRAHHEQAPGTGGHRRAQAGQAGPRDTPPCAAGTHVAWDADGGRGGADDGSGSGPAPGQQGGAVAEAIAPTGEAQPRAPLVPPAARRAASGWGHQRRADAALAGPCGAVRGRAGHSQAPVGSQRQPACQRPGRPRHQPRLRFLRGAAPAGAPAGEPHTRVRTRDAQGSAATSRRWGCRRLVHEVNGELAQREPGEQAQSLNEGEGV